MTNITAAILITITTNWVNIGTFTPARTPAEWCYADYRPTLTVQRGNIVTNTVAVFHWKANEVRTVLEEVKGPEVGERKINDGYFLTNIFNAPISIDMTNIFFHAN